MLILTAEVKIAAIASSQLVMLSYEQLVISVIILVLFMTVFGGMRSQTWIKCAQIILVVLGFLIPLAILAVILTNLPLPQLSYGSVLREVTLIENTLDFGNVADRSFADIISSAAPQPLTKEFVAPFVSLSSLEFVVIVICIMAGVAVLPGTLIQAGTSIGVAGGRKAAGWGMLTLALLLTAIPVYAVFIRNFILQDVLGKTAAEIPDWFNRLEGNGVMFLEGFNTDGFIDISSLLIARDGAVLSLPIVSEFPFIVLVFLGTAGIAAALAAAGSHLFALGATVTSDIVDVYLRSRLTSPSSRLVFARLLMVLFMLAVGVIAVNADYDIVRFALWGVGILASTFFPVLVMSVWWDKTTGNGAVAGMLGGFVIMIAYVVVTEYGYMPLLFGIDSMFAAVFAMPFNTIIIVVLSMLWPQNDAEIISDLHEIRVAEGKTLYDSRRKRK
jgi:cation/acetate symporter